MEHRVINSVPVPDIAGGAGRMYKYPFREMEVGDCIELFDEKGLASARNAAWREKKRDPNFNYTAIAYGHDSKETETGVENGRRVYGRLWRTEPEPSKN